MGKRDARVDAYIAKSAEFARPVLRHLREVVHAGCPEVEEAIKWGMPAFQYKGPLAGMAAFKAHAAFGFWKHDRIVGADPRAKEAMGSFGRLTSVADLPSKATLVRYVKTAKRLADEGVRVPRKKTVKPRFVVPRALLAAIAKAPKARATWDRLSPSHRREYAEWVSEAKRDETRARRLATTVEWLSEGKSRNWRYERR